MTSARIRIGTLAPAMASTIEATPTCWTAPMIV